MGDFCWEESGEFKKHHIICWVLCKNQKKKGPSDCVFSGERHQYSSSGRGGSFFSVWQLGTSRGGLEVPSFQYDNWALISRSKYRLKANRRDSLVVDRASPWEYIFYGFSSILPFRNGREFVVVRKFGWCQCGIVFPISFFLDYVSLKCNASIYSLIWSSSSDVLSWNLRFVRIWMIWNFRNLLL